VSARRFDAGMHRYRVTIDHGGPAGVLLRCVSERTRGVYWKVKLDSGEWVWPDRVVAESTGPCIARCVECELDYRGDSPAAGGLCPNCVRALDRQYGPAHDRGAGPAHGFGRRYRR
jgi:hypothetical protein